MMSAPFPWFGGKRKVAAEVWRRFGAVQNYVEPFFGSGAVLLGRPSPSGPETVNDLDGYVCVAPETRILRKDFRWIPAGDLRAGDQLVSFDEANPGDARPCCRAPTKYRRWRKAHVLAAPRVTRPCYRLTFDDGTSLVCSDNHTWLTGSHRTGSGGRGWRWVATKNMAYNRKTQRSWVLKVAPVIDRSDSYEAGWIGGFFDSEGSLHVGPGARLSAAQNDGPELRQAETWLLDHEFETKIQTSRKCRHITVNGGLKEIFRFLMLTRPQRLIRKFYDQMEHVSLYGRQHSAVALVKKEFLGQQEVVALATSTQTFIAEGLASHNCNFWRSVKHAPQATVEWADWPVSENDLHARHVWLVQQQKSLRARLEGDPDFYDAKIAGWWVWGIACWIGGGFCAGNWPWWVNDERQLVHLGDSGHGVHRKHVQLDGRGHSDQSNGPLGEWFARLSDRFKHVRVSSGDWSRVCGPSVTFSHGLTGVFLDPPYADTAGRDHPIYREDSECVAHAVCDWAIAHWTHSLMRIAICGYEGEHEMPDTWAVYHWSAAPGYSGLAAEPSLNRHRERIWFSPACLAAEQRSLFDAMDTQGP